VGRGTHLARQRRKVIHDGRKLRIRGLDVTVRLNSMNSSSKSPQIDARNLETHGKCCNFVLANKKLRVRVKAAAQHSSSELSSAFTLHFTCQCQKLRARADVERRANDCSGSKFFTFHSSLFTLICGKSATRCSWSQRI
jgi:hypothetical protein